MRLFVNRSNRQSDINLSDTGEMKSLQERLREERKLRGWSQKQLAVKAGVSQTTIADIERGRNQGSTFLPNIAKALDLTVEELIKGSTGPKKVVELTQQQSRTTSLKGFVKVPVVGDAKLGDQGFFVELEFPVGFGDGYIEWPTKDQNAYAIRCVGDSMKPRIRHGEFAIIEPGYQVNPGDDVLVKSIDGKVMIKEFLYERDDMIHLGSVNEAHPKISFHKSEIEIMHYVSGIAKKPMFNQY